MLDTSIERLKEMINKPFLYNGKEVVVINYCDGTGEDGDEVEIYLNDGRTIEVNYAMLSAKLNQFHSVSSNVIVLANQRLEQVSSINPNTIEIMRDTVMEQIRSIKNNPNAMEEAKCVFQGINTMINLAKTELEYRKYINNVNH